MKHKIFILLFAMVASIGTMYAEGIQVGEIRYNFNSNDQTATVTSAGTDTYIGHIEIPSSVEYGGVTYTVTTIGAYAFDACQYLTSIDIPNTVTSIGGGAFRGCSNMTSITIPNSITTIGYSNWNYSGVFNGCTRLNAVYISDLAAWCEIAFADGDSNPLSCAHNLYLNGTIITDLSIPNNITTIKEFAFYGARCIKTISIPNSIVSINRAAFFECSELTSINIPNSVTSIGDNAFSYCSKLTSINIPNSVTSIGYSSFSSCSQLTSINIPNSVTSIGSYAFQNCSSLPSVDIPNSVTSISSGLFYNCSQLTNISLPNSITTIGQVAFAGCSKLSSISIPETVTSIDGGAFDNCRGLKEVHISDLAAWCNISFSIISNDSRNGNPLNYAHHLYLNRTEVTELELPTSVKMVKDYAFYGCSGLTNITFSNNVVAIAKYAFAYCTGISTLEVPISVSVIGENAFKDINLVLYDGTSTGSPWGAKYVNKYIDGDLVFDVDKTRIVECLNKEITELTIPETVTSIDNNVFYNCNNLRTVTCYATTPPSGGNISRINNYNCYLLVPVGSLETYLSTEWWQDFLGIYEIGNVFTVQFVDWDGTLLYEQMVRGGESAIAPWDPTRDDYIFTGWDKDFSSVTEDMVVTAQYIPDVYHAKNLQAVANGDGTYTITWEAAESEEVSYYDVYVLSPIGNYIGYENSRYISENLSYITEFLPWAGTYTCSVHSYNENGQLLSQSRAYITVNTVASHSITARILIQSDSNYDTTEGVTIYRWLSNQTRTSVQANEEGEGWYTYTWTTTDPGIGITLSDNPYFYTYGVNIKRDTCLEYTTDLHYADCNAHIADYTPYNLHAEVGIAQVTLNWDAHDVTDRYCVDLYLDGEYWDSRWTSDSIRSVTLTFSNEEAMNFTWSVRSYSSRERTYVGNTVTGEPFTIAPSPYVPHNLSAIPNGDGRYTISWDAADSEDVKYYSVAVYSPSGKLICQGDAVPYVTDVLPWTGSYTYYVHTYDIYGERLAFSSATLEVASVPEHSITARVLIQPSSGYDTSNGVILYKWSANRIAESFNATADGDGWYSYTWTTTDPGICVSVSDDYWGARRISNDTCLEYTGNLSFVSCDAQLVYYTPYNLHAEPGAGTVTLSWQAQDDADRYIVTIYKDGEEWLHERCSGNLREYVVYISNSTEDSYAWSIRPIVNDNWEGETVYGEEFTVAPSPYVPKHLTATPNEDGTFTITWSAAESKEVNRYRVTIYSPNGLGLDDAMLEDTAYVTNTLPFAGTYICYVLTYDINGDPLGNSYTMFEVASVPEHSITARVLIQPSSGYDTSNGVTLYRWNDDGYIESVIATEEGNNWYTYTWSTTNPGIRVAIKKSYYYGINIFNDTCFEYTSNFHFVNCDARVMDYTPFNLHAESGAGKVTLNWEVNDEPSGFYVWVFENEVTVYSKWFNGSTRSVNLNFSTETTKTCSWGICSYDFYGAQGDMIYGEAFTIEPSPYIPRNLNATPNGDGTFTITWSPVETEDVASYYIDIHDNYYDISAGDWVANDTLYTTPVMPTAGTYTYVVYAMDANWNTLGYAYSTFDVAPAPEHDITVRLLFNLDSEYDTSNGVSFIVKNYVTHKWDTVPAIAEENNWYRYTFTTTDYSISLKLVNTNTFQGITTDTCLQYSWYIQTANCDDVPRDYRIIPESMNAESVPGSVKFSWSAIDKSDAYILELVNSETNTTFAQDLVNDTCHTYIVPDEYDSLVIRWKVYAYQPVYSNAIEAPNTVMLLKKIMREGTCGDNFALTWKYNPQDKSLTISGNGTLNSNYTFGEEAPTLAEKLIISEGVTSIGENAFAGYTSIQRVSVASSVKTIYEHAFYNCSNIHEIYSYRATPSMAYSNTFDGIDKFDCVLYVLTGSVDMYKSATGWRDFYYTQTIDANEVEEPVEDVVVTPGSTTAGVIWPVVSDAATYELIISDVNGNVIIKLTFNAAGQLTGIAFASGKNRRSQQTQIAGFQFTVSGLNEGTTYNYELTVRDEDGEEIETRTGTFTTIGEVETSVEIISDSKEIPVKIFRNGQILILRGDHTYTLTGQEVR